MFLTGQKTLTTSGTAYPIGSGNINQGILIRSASTNTGRVYIGNQAVTIATGFILDAGEVTIIDEVGKASDIYAVGSVNSQVISWMTTNEI